MKSLIRTLVCVSAFVAVSSGLNCPRTYVARSVRVQQPMCWDGSSGSLGCCRVLTRCWGLLAGADCGCSSSCLGWAANFADETDYTFEGEIDAYDNPRSGVNVRSEQGKDIECIDLSGQRSARVHEGSCVKLWDRTGCSGNNVTVNGGTVSDVRTEGLSGIYAVSGCEWNTPEPMNVTLYQSNNIFSLFGSTETIEINPGECTAVGHWWANRVSLIKSLKHKCYKVWELQHCSGKSYCNCETPDFGLSSVEMDGSTSWDDHVRGLSFCNYED